MVIDDNCRSFAFVLSVYAKTVEGRPFASLVCNVCTCCGVAESLHSRMLLWWTVWYRGLWRWKSLEVKLDWSSLVNRALQKFWKGIAEPQSNDASFASVIFCPTPVTIEIHLTQWMHHLSLSPASGNPGTTLSGIVGMCIAKAGRGLCTSDWTLE